MKKKCKNPNKDKQLPANFALIRFIVHGESLLLKSLCKTCQVNDSDSDRLVQACTYELNKALEMFSLDRKVAY